MRGNCQQALKMCYRCKQIEHYAKDFPQEALVQRAGQGRGRGDRR